MKTSFYKLDRWVRKRIRCMKYKRIWLTDNWRYTVKHIEKMGQAVMTFIEQDCIVEIVPLFKG